jgi:hypothetical protein
MHQVQERLTDIHPLVQSVNRTVFARDGQMTFLPDQAWDLTFIRNRHGLMVLRTGLTTRPVQFDYEEGDENFSIAFRPHALMPLLPGDRMRDEGVMLETAGPDRFMLGSDVFEIPRIDTVESLVTRLLSREAVETNPLVASVTAGHPMAATERTLQRHFLRTTGLTLKTFSQIARARQAMTMLAQGTAAAEIAFTLGYADQPHLIRSLRTFMGATPGQIARAPADVVGRLQATLEKKPDNSAA